MWRSSIRESVEKEPEALARLHVGQTERFEHPRLHILAMNSNTSGTEFVAVQNEIVSLRPALPRRSFELVQIFLKDSGERMLRAHPALIRRAPFKKREAGDPREFPFAAVDKIEFVAKVQANLTGHVQ